MMAYDPHQQHHVADYGRRYHQEYAAYYAQRSATSASSSSIPSSSAASSSNYNAVPVQSQAESAYGTPSTMNGTSSTVASTSNGNGNGMGSAAASAPSSTYSGSAHPSPEAGAFLDDPYQQQMHAQAQQQQQQYAAQGSRPPSASSHSQHQQGSNHSSPASSSAALQGQAQSSTSAAAAHAHAGSQSSSTSSALIAGTPLSRPLTHKEQELLAHLDRLKFFLATAPSRWSDSEVPGADVYGGRSMNGMGTPMMPHPNMHPALNRFLLPSGEYLSLSFSFIFRLAFRLRLHLFLGFFFLSFIVILCFAALFDVSVPFEQSASVEHMTPSPYQLSASPPSFGIPPVPFSPLILSSASYNPTQHAHDLPFR